MNSVHPNEPFKLDPELVYFDDYRDADGVWSYDTELAVIWSKKSEQEKQDTIRYVKLLKRFTKNPDLISNKHKKWLLENCALETESIPLELMDELWIE